VETRILVADDAGAVVATHTLPAAAPPGGWVWIDVTATADDVAELLELTNTFHLDRLAVRDAVLDVDMPKADDFGHHLLIVLHGLDQQAAATYEIDCFLTHTHLITIRNCESAAVDSLWSQVQHRAELARAEVDEVAALLADLMTRRLLAVLEAFDARIEELTGEALRAKPTLLEDLTAVRTDLAGVRRVVHPQRETLDQLRHSTSDLISDSGRRRFSDVFDVALRLAAGLDEARSALAETLDAYRGAEARQATEVSKVLTVYAAIILPLSLITGFFGMNFTNLPLIHTRWGWLAVTAAMALVSFVSLGIFISLGWVRRPSGRRTGQTLGRGLVEATRAPVQIVGAMLEMSTMPLRATGTRLRQVVELTNGGSGAGDEDDDDVREARRSINDPGNADDASHHGSE
jgi:magnesium transporter